MKRIKKRARTNTTDSEKRHSTTSVGHWIYYMLLCSVGSAFVWYMIGNKFFLSTDGLVIQEHVKIETPTTLMVAQVFVQPGDEVEENQAIMRVQMPTLQLKLVEMGERIRKLEIEQTRMQQSTDESSRQMPYLLEQIKMAKDNIRRDRRLLALGLITRTQLEEKQIRLDELRKEVARLEVRSEEIPEENYLTALRRQYFALRNIIGDGYIRSPVAGTVGKISSKEGTVATPGEELIDIIFGKKYVLAYLDDSYLFPLHEGQKVKISAYHKSVEGKITSFLPYSEALPEEFQTTISKRENALLARVDIESSENLVMNEHVRISLGLSPTQSLLRKLAGLWQPSSSPGPENNEVAEATGTVLSRLKPVFADAAETSEFASAD